MKFGRFFLLEMVAQCFQMERTAKKNNQTTLTVLRAYRIFLHLERSTYYRQKFMQFG
jgi:hypothetical protein